MFLFDLREILIDLSVIQNLVLIDHSIKRHSLNKKKRDIQGKVSSS